MKQAWSPHWISSSQPRKQRKYRYNAPLHVRHKFVSASLSPSLRRETGKRSLPLRKGDEIEIMRGSLRGFKGVVERVDLEKCKVYVENANAKKADGTEVARPFDPSNLKITNLSMDDKRRVKALERGGRKPAERKPEKPKEGKASGK